MASNKVVQHGAEGGDINPQVMEDNVRFLEEWLKKKEKKITAEEAARRYGGLLIGGNPNGKNSSSKNYMGGAPKGVNENSKNAMSRHMGKAF